MNPYFLIHSSVLLFSWGLAEWKGQNFCSFPKTLGILVWVSIEFSYAGCTNISMKPLVGVFKKEKKKVGGGGEG